MAGFIDLLDRLGTLASGENTSSERYARCLQQAAEKLVAARLLPTGSEHWYFANAA